MGRDKFNGLIDKVERAYEAVAKKIIETGDKEFIDDVMGDLKELDFNVSMLISATNEVLWEKEELIKRLSR